jgi:retron-type reverse transcriptase
MSPRVSWVLEGDLVGGFDTIPHHGLLKAGARRIAAGKVLSFVSAFLRAGDMENWQYYRTYSGPPQGGIIRPLLCTLFLHQLDADMYSLGVKDPRRKRRGF